MSFYSLLSLIAFLFSFFIGIYVYSKSPKDKINISFFHLCLVESLRELYEFVLKLDISYGSAQFWLKIGDLIWIIMPLFILFIFRLFYKKLSVYQIAFIVINFIISLAFIIIDLTTNLISIGPIKNIAGWGFVYSKTSIFPILALSWLFITGFICEAILLLNIIRTKSRTFTNQLLLILIGSSISFSIGLFGEIVYNYLNLKIQYLVSFRWIIGNIFIAYAIIRYKLFNLTASFAAETIISTMEDALFIVDPYEKIKIVNNSTTKLLNFEKDELIDKEINFLFENEVYESDYDNHQHLDSSSLDLSRNNVDLEKILISKNKHRISVSISTSRIFDSDNNLAGTVLIARDITVRKEQENKIKHQSLHDGLTKLPNRALIFDRIQSEINKSKRYSLKFALMYIDLDNFKLVNDNFGHDSGDEVIQEFAYILKQSIRDSDTAARVGGDEFLILLLNTHTESEIAIICGRIFNNMRKSNIFSKYLSLGASIGVSFYPENGDSMDLLIKNSDKAMYDSKNNGKNMYSIFREE